MKGKTLWVILLWLTLWTLSPEHSAAQTTIVAVRTPEEIVIGADSKMMDLRDRSFDSTICKIRKIDDLFFAFAGFLDIPGLQSDLTEVVREASRSGDSITEKIETFDGLIVRDWSQGLPDIRDDHPELYRQKLRGKIVLQIAFAGIERGKPLLFMRYLKVVERGDVPSIVIYKKQCPGDCPLGKVYAFLGHTGALKEHMAGGTDIWDAGYAEGIRRLITIQMEAEPEHVGPPIDILRLDSTGYEWIQKKPECFE